MLPATCLFCDSTDSRPADFPRATLFNGRRFGYKECRVCHLVYIDPLPNQEELAQMYTAEYHDDFYFQNAPSQLCFIEHLQSSSLPRKILDYGCGDGGFLRAMAGFGYECVGVEYSPELVTRLSLANPEMRFYTVDGFWSECQECFSNIHMGDALEHLSQPGEVLTRLRDRMLQNGLLWIEGPLENNFHLALAVRKLLSRLKKHQVAHHVPYHLSFSDAQNQEQLFVKNRFQSLEMRVLETPWPYPEQFSIRPLELFQYLVARLSVAVSAHVPWRWGNRFQYLGRRAD